MENIILNVNGECDVKKFYIISSVDGRTETSFHKPTTEEMDIASGARQKEVEDNKGGEGNRRRNRRDNGER